MWATKTINGYLTQGCAVILCMVIGLKNVTMIPVILVAQNSLHNLQLHGNNTNKSATNINFIDLLLITKFLW